MTDAFRTRPSENEYAPYYAGYVAAVPDGSLLETYKVQHAVFERLFNSIGIDRADHVYEPGKWTVREVLGHINDTERVFAYRALTFARGIAGPLPGMDQNQFVEGGHFATRPLASLVDEFVHVRAASISLLKGMTKEDLVKRGTASGSECTVRAMMWIMAGHAQHHVNILQERYLK